MDGKRSGQKAGIAAWAASALLLGGCLFSGDGEDTSSSKSRRAFNKFAVAGDSASEGKTFLRMTFGFQTGYCNGDSLVPQSKEPVAHEFELRGDTLRMWYSRDFMDPALQLHDVYARKGAGVGRIGEWKRVRTVLLNPNGSEVPEHMKQDRARRDSAFLTETMVIGGDSLKLFYERTPEYLVWEMVEKMPKGITYAFHGQDSTRFTKAGVGTVVFRTTADNVLHVIPPKQEDAEYLMPGIPAKCPPDTAKPAWLREFFGLEAEADPLAKRSAFHPARR